MCAEECKDFALLCYSLRKPCETMLISSAFNLSLEIWGCILSLLIIIYIARDKKAVSPRSKAFLLLSVGQFLLLLSDAAAILSQGNPSYFNHFIVCAEKFISFTLVSVVLFFTTCYLLACLAEYIPVSKSPLCAVGGLSLFSLLLLLISQFNHMYYVVDAESLFVVGPLYWFPLVVCIFTMCINGWAFHRHRLFLPARDRFFLGICIILNIIAPAAQILFPQLALFNLSSSVALVTLFLFIQLDQSRRLHLQELQLAQQQTALAKADAELMDTRMNLMISQIQPHFIYNTLGTIRHLCLTQPEQAAQVVQDFSQYLRGNFDELESRAPIRLSREIQHVKHYTAIETIRFPDMQIGYDLRSQEFFLPALSIQPLVENAIKHGLMGLESGGTVTISTYETDAAYCVCVKDDGVGFDPSIPSSVTGRKHIGIPNIRERLARMCGGTLTIESTPGHGTSAVISIPKEDIT